MKPYIYGPKFMWNLDCSVGKGGANSNSADVSFLQWYYTHAANFHLTTPENKAIYRHVTVTGICNGKDSDPLVAAIIAQQKSLSHPTIDGKASVVTGPGKSAPAHSSSFALRPDSRSCSRTRGQGWISTPGCPGTVQIVSKGTVPRLEELNH